MKISFTTQVSQRFGGCQRALVHSTPWRLVIWAVVCTGTISLVSCQNPAWQQRNLCPPDLKAIPSPTGSGIQWGGDKAKVEAGILSVAAECIPVHHRPIEAEKVKRAAFTDYQISATASVGYRIADPAFFETAMRHSDLNATAVFEVLSSSAVVLGSGRGSFRVVKGGSTGTVSATISGLSEEAIRRVAVVQVRWEYGR